MFTPIETTIGALLLHQAATGFLFKNGEVLGASGLLHEAMFGASRRTIVLLAGMAASILIVSYTLPELLPTYPSVRSWRSVALSATAGLMTGIGTKLSSGCTSGHMLCGLSRLSARSFVAVMTFFPVAILAFNVFHGSGTPTSVCPIAAPCYEPAFPSRYTAARLIALASGLIALYHTSPSLILSRFKSRKVAYQASTFLTGTAFGTGLLASGMANPGKVVAFFAFPTLHNWDPSLLLLIVFGIIPSLAYNQLHGIQGSPQFASRFNLPQKSLKDTDWTFVAGAVLFGLSWGISGVCPGPAVLRTFAQPLWGFLWISGFYFGSIAAASWTPVQSTPR